MSDEIRSSLDATSSCASSGSCTLAQCDGQHAPGQRPPGLRISRAHTCSETGALQKAKVSKGSIFFLHQTEKLSLSSRLNMSPVQAKTESPEMTITRRISPKLYTNDHKLKQISVKTPLKYISVHFTMLVCYKFNSRVPTAGLMHSNNNSKTNTLKR